MKRAIVCAGLILALSGAVTAHETKKKPVLKSIDQICADPSLAKAKQVDCKTTATVSASKQPPKADAKKQPEPRLGYGGNPWIITVF